jgi:hypothetical protein
MSETYTKLFGSITRSSVWLEDDQTLRVWVTMLALADRHGYVGASLGGLAAIARVDRRKTAEAIDKFLSPDPDSRSRDHEGRRIEVADRGWLVLNYDRFRDLRDEEAHREFERNRKREARKRNNINSGRPDMSQMSHDVPKCPTMSQEVAQAEAEAEAEAEKRGMQGGAASADVPLALATVPSAVAKKRRAPDAALVALRTALAEHYTTPPAITGSNEKRISARIRAAVDAGVAGDVAEAAWRLVAAAKSSGGKLPWVLLDTPLEAPTGALFQNTHAGKILEGK